MVDITSYAQNSFVVQGLEIDVSAHHFAVPFLSNYFRSLYQGETPLDTGPLRFELQVIKQPPFPDDTVRAIKGPTVTSYTNGKEIHFVSEDSSIIYFDPAKKKATGFLKEDILQDAFKLYPLMSALIAEALGYHGFHYLHAAGLYGHEMGYLVSGDGGSGKTTAALSMVGEGFNYASDDSLFLKEHEGEILILPFFGNRNFHLDQDLLNRFPDLAEGNGPKIQDGAKMPVNISKLCPELFIPVIRPHVIIFPKITAQPKSVLSLLPRVEVFRRLLKQTILAVDKAILRAQLNVMQRLVEQATGFELLSGRDLYENPKSFVSLLETVSL